MLCTLYGHARDVAAHLIAPALRLSGFRFSKDYRRGVTRWHRAIYACVSTVGANSLADGDRWHW